MAKIVDFFIRKAVIGKFFSKEQHDVNHWFALCWAYCDIKESQKYRMELGLHRNALIYKTLLKGMNCIVINALLHCKTCPLAS